MIRTLLEMTCVSVSSDWFVCSKALPAKLVPALSAYLNAKATISFCIKSMAPLTNYMIAAFVLLDSATTTKPRALF